MNPRAWLIKYQTDRPAHADCMRVRALYSLKGTSRVLAITPMPIGTMLGCCCKLSIHLKGSQTHPEVGCFFCCCVLRWMMVDVYHVLVETFGSFLADKTCSTGRTVGQFLLGLAATSRCSQTRQMAANEQPKKLQITRIRWAKSRYVRNLRNKKDNRFWNLENKNLEEQRSYMKQIYFPQLYLSLYLCMPQITKFSHPKALQLHSKQDVLDLRASGWEDNKVVITPEFAGSAGLLRLYVFLLLFLADPSIYRISQYEPDDFMTTLRQPKNWKRQESLVTSREEVGDPRHMSFWKLEDFIRGCLIFGTFFMVASFAMPLRTRTSLYFETYGTQ